MIYKTRSGLKGTIEEFKNMLDKYSLDEVQELYSDFPLILKKKLRGYLLERMRKRK